MTLQEMHEAVCTKREKDHAMTLPKLTLMRSLGGTWRAAWSGSTMAGANTAQSAIDAAFKLAMEDA